MNISDGKIQIGHILLNKEVGFDKFKVMYSEYMWKNSRGGK